MPRIDFYFDVVCPFAFMAFRRLDTLRRVTGAEVRLRPVLLGGLLREVGGPSDPNTVMAPARAAINRRDILNWASAWELPLRIPSAHPRRSVDAMRLCIAASGERREAVAAELFDAYWIDGADITAPEVLARVAARHGMKPGVEKTDAARAGLRTATHEAALAGAFGVPTFSDGTRVVWGQDRWQVVAAMCGVDGGELAPAWKRRATAPSVPVAAPATVRFFHDFASPFSYLAHTQMDALGARTGAAVEHVPILTGAVFSQVGTPGVPLFEMNAAKQAYARRDLDDWAKLWGVPFAFPGHFPMRSVLPLRAAVVEPKVAAHLYRAAWAEDRVIDTPDGLGAVLTDAGFDAAGILAGCERAEVKATLRANTEAAVVAGACGVPTFVVDTDGASPTMLWGQDRLSMLEAMLEGWHPDLADAGASDPGAR